MRAAVRRGDVVGEGVYVLRVGVVVLHGHLDQDPVLDAFGVDGLREQHLLVLVQVLDELLQAAFEAEVVLLRFLAPLVPEDDPHALVQERHLPQAVAQYVVLELAGLKDSLGIVLALHVRPELDGCAGAVGRADHLQVVDVFAPFILLLVDLAVLVHRHGEMPAQRVHHAGADAVQAAGNLVSPAAEFAAGVQDRQADFHRRAMHLRMQADREAAPVVHDRHGAVLVQRDVDLVAEAGQRLVHGVVHDFIHQVMQTPRVCRADIHARAFPHGFQALQDLDLLLAVVGGHSGHLFHFEIHSFSHFAPHILSLSRASENLSYQGGFIPFLKSLNPLKNQAFQTSLLYHFLPLKERIFRNFLSYIYGKTDSRHKNTGQTVFSARLLRREPSPPP